MQNPAQAAAQDRKKMTDISFVKEEEISFIDSEKSEGWCYI